MLRSVQQLCRQLQSSVTLTTALLPGKTLPACAQVMSRHPFHISAACPVLDKDLKGKKKLIRLAQDAKVESTDLTKEEVDIDVEGLTASGISIPTLETLDMTVNGIRFAELPIVNIKSSPNNTIMSLTDHTGQDILAVASCGMEGFKNVKKSTNVAAQATGFSMGHKTKRKGIKAIRVKVKGLGAGRLSSIKGLQMAGLKIVSITDNTPVIHTGPRPRKQKRL